MYRNEKLPRENEKYSYGIKKTELQFTTKLKQNAVILSNPGSFDRCKKEIQLLDLRILFLDVTFNSNSIIVTFMQKCRNKPMEKGNSCYGTENTRHYVLDLRSLFLDVTRNNGNIYVDMQK